MTAPSSINTWITGIPSRVKRGKTVTFTLRYRLQTRETYAPLTFELDMGSAGPAGNAQYKGVSSTYFDPATRKWEKPSHAPHSADFVYTVGGTYPSVKLKPGALGQVTIRVTFGKDTYLGTWWTDGSVYGYLLKTGGGFDSHYPSESMKVTRFSVYR
ncbi:hypothetical protein [Peterkaempfera sp. SMS 1(5)a]|uniref:hypothetical protein n=1 Tax=Peterkaempfera podocarpi TaxID=3232308 RepID=UPI003670D984